MERGKKEKMERVENTKEKERVEREGERAQKWGGKEGMREEISVGEGTNRRLRRGGDGRRATEGVQDEGMQRWRWRLGGRGWRN